MEVSIKSRLENIFTWVKKEGEAVLGRESAIEAIATIEILKQSVDVADDQELSDLEDFCDDFEKMIIE